MLKKIIINSRNCLGVLLFFSLFNIVNASPTIDIYTENKVYNYGDFLTFTLEVSEVTGEVAILHIIDSVGKKSSAIPIPITEKKTVIPSPYPFESTVYPEGNYTLQIEYSGSSDEIEFEIVDAGNVVIPIWIKEFSKYWYNGAISDEEFAGGIQFLIKEGIVTIPQSKQIDNATIVKIPFWVKTTTGWWIDGLVSDEEFASALEYLIKVGIIIV